MTAALQEVANAAEELLNHTNCRKHFDRAKRRLLMAVARAGKPDAEDPVRVLAREMAEVLAADYDEDPVAAALVERAVGLGLSPATEGRPCASVPSGER